MIEPEVDRRASGEADAPGRLPGTWIEEVVQTPGFAPTDDEPLAELIGGEAGLAPEADFAPLGSWDPLADVGWRAVPAATELDVEAETLALQGENERAPVEAEGSSAGPTPAPAGSATEEETSEEDGFASRLEALAAAIRRGKVEDLLAENPQDALTALVAGYYLGAARRKGGSGS